MIPALNVLSPIDALYIEFLDQLASASFQGDIARDDSNRVTLSTDNSIYQILPQAVIYPRHKEDVVAVCKLAAEERFHDIVLSPRGGGTGTNGQSLCDGIIVDISKYMNRILEINVEEKWARVEAGVVKDQLGAAIAKHGLFFAPELSTSNRATVGGMINTDASGQGSCAYGKTRDHVLELSTVFLGGELFTSSPISRDELRSQSAKDTRIASAHRLLADIQDSHAEKIDATFPKLNRCLTGYDLAHIFTQQGDFDLNSILCGSEGTLGFIVEAKLNLLDIPSHSALVNVCYTDFDASLRDAQALMAAAPTSIETVDSRVLELARSDNSWHTVEQYFPASEQVIAGVNLVEYTANSEAELAEKLAGFEAKISELNNPSRLSFSIAMSNAEVSKIWAMRKKAVGLLGNMQSEARPVAFVEDTCVPPENLADFIAEFGAILDAGNLRYGMFGHVDAGVLHVRPALDMKNDAEIARVREITDKVVALTQKYNGLLWGEHGKGVRSEYAPEFFGDLYPVLQKVKALFDPHNQLNPGKICTPSDEYQLYKIDEVPTRGDSDRLIASSAWNEYSEAVYCNGNGACFNWNPDDAMCPSWKGTRQRIHSPKGRASLVREWLKQLSQQGVDLEKTRESARYWPAIFTLYDRALNTLALKSGRADFSHEVFESMAGCLGCKSCTGQCPINVDVPTFRSKFLEIYYSRYLRPAKDYVIASLEFALPLLKYTKPIYNSAVSMPLVKRLMASTVQMVDSPMLSEQDLQRTARSEGFKMATSLNVGLLSHAERDNTVVVVQDAFTSHFDAEVVLDMLRLLRELGFNAMLAPYKPNGKPQHFYGFLKGFGKTAQKNAAMLYNIQHHGIPLVGVDPALTMTYRDEYVKAGIEHGFTAPKVSLLQEFLVQHLDKLEAVKDRFASQQHTLLGHCTEKTNAPTSTAQWQKVFAALGQSMTSQNVGCCGMAGTYGHEAKNQETSRTIYDLSWKRAIESDTEQRIMATGFSCRSQVKRFSERRLPHPAQSLLKALQRK